MLTDIRAFFAAREVLEVETPVLSQAATPDPHLHSFKTHYRNQLLYLNTSPEFAMKRLLADGSGDIYQLCKVFRDDEQGSRHNPEFTLLEWYRLGMDRHQLMDEVEFLLASLLDEFPGVAKRISYQQAFIDALGIDPLETSIDELSGYAQSHRVDIPVGMESASLDDWLDWLLTQCVISQFEPRKFTFLYDYPASQAALARLDNNDPRVAHRFELFVGELELANGFHELTDADEQAQRFMQQNQQRENSRQLRMPLDENFIHALQAGLPECAGVALGIDRLLMIATGAISIDQVLAFSIERA